MGACHNNQKQKRKCSLYSDNTNKIDFTCQRLSLYLELVGDTNTLGGYLQEKIQELFEIRHKLNLVKNQFLKKELLDDATNIIEYLYQDKHFSQAFPILRESLYEITHLTTDCL